MNEKTDLNAIARASKLIAGIDVIISTVCAANGNAYFVPFMILAGLMWLNSVYMQSKADSLEG